MIEVRNLVKRFGTRLALDDVSFQVEPGRVTAFLGPNGSGKTTTMRILLGLDTATSGSALVDGLPYGRLKDPMCRVGALLDARNAHPGRSAFHHLRALALTHGLSSSRVDEVLDDVGLSDVANNRIGGFSLGMRQRLGIAGAMLGDPRIYVFDEPVNGLDPDGVRWFRDLVRSFAAEGRAVFLSSHLISEVALTADQVIVLGRGRVLADAPIAELARFGSSSKVWVRSPQAGQLTESLRLLGASVDAGIDGFWVEGIPASRVGNLAAELGAQLHELRTAENSLEDSYRALTEATVEYRPGLR
ncbi:MAG: ATP-binding cassette domain-containing protein [Rhodoglobus sp.]